LVLSIAAIVGDTVGYNIGARAAPKAIYPSGLVTF